MSSSPSHLNEGHLVLIFGSQSLDFNEDSATQLRSSLLSNPTLAWIPETIIELQDIWGSISEAVPAVQDYPGAKYLQWMKDWIRTGKFPAGSFPLPSIVLTPLVVISHLVQFSGFLDLIQPNPTTKDKLTSLLLYRVETLGLCTGLLSSVAVSSSANLPQLKKYGAAAIRIAAAVGGFVDAKDLENGIKGKWKSISVGWSSPEGDEEILRILKSFPEAYISVVSEKRRVTISSPASNYAVLTKQLKDAGLTIAEIALQGAFHFVQQRDDAEFLAQFLDSNPKFQFPNATEAVLQTWSNTSGDYIRSGELHHVVVRSMLVEQSVWHDAFEQLESSILTPKSHFVSFGRERCVPPSLIRKLGSRLTQIADFNQAAIQLPTSFSRFGGPSKQNRDLLADGAVAVVGISCQLPGATDLNEFWDALCAGKSQHIEVPDNRFDFQTAWRELDPKRKWYGNFIQDYDTFDHKFFKKSPREMSSTDPQHRLMLQVAYQAVEQSGYFNMTSPDQHIGCYIGVGLVDYENNVACYPATAYSATGNLKSFAAGKISHYFGWTGPGLTIDTACSSSAVAIHQACRAILTDECSAALAGGINMMTSPEWFQNLAGASFLSPTGQCKPFDINADGYCRGEGVGAVFLKKLSAAVEDGNQILGVIAASGVYQNQNCTAITVPNAISLSDLFRDVTRRAGLEPEQITVVEAHGTGTQVGDPAEYDSVRQVFGGSIRSKALSLGSVKGLLGHTESASGIVALIKILLMIIKGAIPPQASFLAINPAVNALLSDNIEITTKLRRWDADFRASLINNYGASGSNASLVVTQAPPPELEMASSIPKQPFTAKHPFWLCGFDDRSLRAYSSRLLHYLKSSKSRGEHLSVADLSFQVSLQSNRTLNQALIFGCSSIQELEEKLTAIANNQEGAVGAPRAQSTRPVVLCFGGQISTYIGLDQDIYCAVKILRNHLDQCNEICVSLGLESIYPGIFQRSPIFDAVKLQTMLFSLQYSCAMSWIKCGVKVAAVVGHSFGELTAMCVSGILTPKETLKMIATRARIIRDSWGPERGSMMAVEADLDDVEKLLSEAQKVYPGESPVNIACFNGPRSFTLAGSAKAIQGIKEIIASNKLSSPVKAKLLDVTNAFHSKLVEALVPELEAIGLDLVFKEPIIPFEKATEKESTNVPQPNFVATHMRNPVYFNHAIQRLSQRYGSCIWLESGSNSTITNMTSRALDSPKDSHFQPVYITGNGAFQALTDATMSLWKEGLNIKFWAHHSKQSSAYSPLLLPPYQFEKSKHWMELKKPQKIIAQATLYPEISEAPKGLWTFVGYQDAEKHSVRFRVNTMTDKYQKLVSAHVIAGTAPICPSTFQLVIAVDALMSLMTGVEKSDLLPELRGMDSHAPMCMDASKYVWLEAEKKGSEVIIWDWKMFSTAGSSVGSDETLHVSGKIGFRSASYTLRQNDFEKYERLIGRQRYLSLLDGNQAEEVIQGKRNIYKAFSDIVDYKDNIYKGLQKIAGKGAESAGRVTLSHSGETWLDLGLADSFCQVAGIYLNSMVNHAENDMYISDRIDQWIRSPKVSVDSYPHTWEIFACHHRPSDKECTSDVFAFDHSNGQLVEVILGIHYIKVSKAGMGKLLSRLSPQSKSSQSALPSAPVEIPLTNGVHQLPSESSPDPVQQTQPKKKEKATKKSSRLNISGKVQGLLCNLSGLESDDVKLDSDLVDLGIDSLMGMELAREVEAMFKITLNTSDLLDLTDFQSLINCIQAALGITDGPESEDETKPGDFIDNKSYSSTNGTITPSTAGIAVPTSAILDAFAEAKQATDRFIEEYKFSNYAHHVLPKSTELCIVHIVDGLEELGCPIRTAKPGQALDRIKYLPRHEKFVEFLYGLLERARIIDVDGARVTRTAIAVPGRSAETLLQELLRDSPDHAYDHKLTYLTGCRLADCLTGKADGLQIIFASAEGREIVSGMYGKSPINVAWIKQMEHFLKKFFLCLPKQGGPIKILEMGAGTGGTTARLVPLLASLGIPFQYTVTDLSSSLVAAARKRFKEYSFMEYKVLDIEKPPTAELLQSQHLVIATNCVHATHSLEKSTKNIHDLLRPDGFLMMLEMTESIPWIDLAFGLLEGWWLFDDGRRHALVSPTQWESTLKSVGFGHVDWTDGNLPETAIQRIIIALASGPSYDRVPKPPKPLPNHITDFAARQLVVDSFIEKYSHGFSAPEYSHRLHESSNLGQCVLLTGATGSLGSHLVAYFALQPTVKMVICLNRYNSTECMVRQIQALESRGLFLDSETLSKLKVLETNTSKPMLGLSNMEYTKLVNSVTSIVHNAWPMSITRPVNAFEPQFMAMRNLIQLARECSGRRHQNEPRIGFQFISSIATVGYYPLWSGRAIIPEDKMTVDSVLPTGYGDAKLICERILDETLHKYPNDFRPMVVRIGQIAGSKTSGYWNPVEHLAFLIKSSHVLRILPNFEGVINDVAASLGELLLNEITPYQIYHIENPARQPWRDMVEVLAEGLGIPRENVIPFNAWIDRVRQFPPSLADIDNPAARLAEFLDSHFVRMSCGDLILDTAHTTEHSETLRNSRPLSRDLVMKYIRAWKKIGFLAE
ncbi:hypothetical protein OIDMADRAFT_45882 [Oidiodendron maius Zn]|uniref:Uncharacterized protein n=1 Tax=Oidiodendron maius (strain Zn) TaxID=913774 RepID=A0A0C3GUR3_OIDMZ|nr:hypothetical protein OIDMADRAFT_45882 [Oidiodendron maius Zn]